YMRKTLVIAWREYFAVVRSKAFLISLVLLPVMMFAPGVVQKATSKVMDIRDRRFAVVDRTSGAQLFPELAKAVEERNATKIFDPETRRQVEPKFVLEQVPPAPDETVLQQQFELANRVRKGELFGFL